MLPRADELVSLRQRRSFHMSLGQRPRHYVHQASAESAIRQAGHEGARVALLRSQRDDANVFTFPRFFLLGLLHPSVMRILLAPSFHHTGYES
jgi:hypothetical protein